MFDLNEINLRTVSDPKGFCEECDAEYMKQVKTAASKIADNSLKCPIVLLSGPSGSGKTTTSMKVSEALEKLGIKTHYIAMDDYYNTVTPENTPKTPEGEYDLESPLCLDLPLMNRHFTKLAGGEEIAVPKYNFATRTRDSEPSKTLKLGKDEVVVFEGIHALNEVITSQHSEAFKLYVSTRSDVEFKDIVVFKRTWFRLVRRLVRDFNYRGAAAEETMSMWANVRRGEKKYISPYKNKADYQFNTAMPCELAVFHSVATKLFRTVPDGIERYDELKAVLPALQLFGEISDEFVANDSLLREFIGGGVYSY